jgi:UDP-N-acetylglucosamine 4,6-dehydratase
MIIDKKIIIIGGTGSLGNALCDKYLLSNEILIYSRSENLQWEMKFKYNNKNLSFFVGDIRDKERLETAIFRFKPNIVIIAAALKHIDICENNINECINTNIDGIRNIVNIISNYSMIGSVPFIETVCFISTDKACAPVNTYGMCKSISERIMIEKSQFITSPKFVIVRYGNVLSSRGSLIPFYKSLIKNKTIDSYIPVTHEKMSRYFMTLEESVSLIEYAILNSESGDTVIPKNISSYKILDIANYVSILNKIPVKITGLRPGEKLSETLISFTESLRTVEVKDYFIIKPTFKQNLIQKHVSFENGEFNSETNLKVIDETILNTLRG